MAEGKGENDHVSSLVFSHSIADKELVLGRAKLAELAQTLVRRTFIICDEVLMKIGMKARELEAVFLAGGATHLQVIREGVEAYFGQSGLCSLDPMEVVALGAAMQGDFGQSGLCSLDPMEVVALGAAMQAKTTTYLLT